MRDIAGQGLLGIGVDRLLDIYQKNTKTYGDSTDEDQNSIDIIRGNIFFLFHVHAP